MLIAGLLHDVVEDTYAFGSRKDAAARIQRRYNKRVAAFVLALTKESCAEEAEKPERDRRYFESIIAEGPKTMIIKLADRLDNLRSLDACSTEKKAHYVEETKRYILPMAMEAARQVTEEIADRIMKARNEMAIICETTKMEVDIE